jgi:hypothetical protein
MACFTASYMIYSRISLVLLGSSSSNSFLWNITRRERQRFPILYPFSNYVIVP